jgi:hypothetical protein
MANKYLKRSPVSLITGEMQIKITKEYHFTPAEKVITKKKKKENKITSADEDVKKNGTLCMTCESEI